MRMQDEPIFEPYLSKRAYRTIAQEIQRAILAGRLNAGEHLPSERALARQFQVGRLTIREALRTLEARGLIQIKHGLGGGSHIGVPDPTVLPTMIVDNLEIEGLTSRGRSPKRGSASSAPSSNMRFSMRAGKISTGLKKMSGNLGRSWKAPTGGSVSGIVAPSLAVRYFEPPQKRRSPHFIDLSFIQGKV